MCDLYYDMLKTHFEVENYLNELKGNIEILRAKAIAVSVRCNDKSNIKVLEDIKKQMTTIDNDVSIVAYLLNQIDSIKEQFFREMLDKDIPKTAEQDYISFKNSSTFKGMMGQKSLKL